MFYKEIYEHDHNLVRISQFSMTIFYKYIYLIINTLTNVVIRDYSEISSTERSYCIEASKLTGFCSIRVFRERYFRSIHTSEILWLLNYFIFVNLFELAICSDHCPTLLKFVQEGYFLFFRDAG